MNKFRKVPTHQPTTTTDTKVSKAEIELLKEKITERIQKDPKKAARSLTSWLRKAPKNQQKKSA